MKNVFKALAAVLLTGGLALIQPTPASAVDSCVIVLVDLDSTNPPYYENDCNPAPDQSKIIKIVDYNDDTWHIHIHVYVYCYDDTTCVAP